MKVRDFIKLPLGFYKLNDGIWDYELSKFLSDGKITCYRLKLFGSLPFSEHVFMSEDKEDVYDEGYKTGKFFRPTLRGLAGVGGIMVHGNIGYLQLNNLKLITKLEKPNK